MSQLNPMNSRSDQDANRRRALSKVYSILLKLADEVEIQKAPLDSVAADEKEFVAEPIFVQLELINS